MIHVLPENDTADHNTDSKSCWCHPEYYVLCPECEGEKSNWPCWRCDREKQGLLLLTDVLDSDEPLLVVHNALDGTD